VLGHSPDDILYLAQAASDAGLSTDLSGISMMDESIDDVAAFHKFTFPYNEDNTLPLGMEKMGIKGLKFHNFDPTLCTYCTPLIGMLLTIISMSYKGKPFDSVEFLTGKRLRPSAGMKKSILVGQCMCTHNKDHDGPQEIVKIKGCPPDPVQAASALQSIGIDVDPSVLTNFEMAGAFMMERFKDRPEFDPSLYTI